MNDLPKLANSFPCYAVSKHRLSLVLLETNSYRYFTCSQLPGLQKPSLLVLKSENVLVAQDPTTTTATRERHQKSKRFNMQNNIFARAPYLFCHFFHDYDANQQLRICLSLSELGQSKLLGDLLPVVAVLVS